MSPTVVRMVDMIADDDLLQTRRLLWYEHAGWFLEHEKQQYSDKAR
jgi:hypothetical protein